MDLIYYSQQITYEKQTIKLQSLKVLLETTCMIFPMKNIKKNAIICSKQNFFLLLQKSNKPFSSFVWLCPLFCKYFFEYCIEFFKHNWWYWKISLKLFNLVIDQVFTFPHLNPFSHFLEEVKQTENKIKKNHLYKLIA